MTEANQNSISIFILPCSYPKHPPSQTLTKTNRNAQNIHQKCSEKSQNDKILSELRQVWTNSQSQSV